MKKNTGIFAKMKERKNKLKNEYINPNQTMIFVLVMLCESVVMS